MARRIVVKGKKHRRGCCFARLSRDEGFSVVEVLMASALMLVVLAAVYGIWFGLQRTYGYAEEDMLAQSEARAAMNEMVEFIRTAREPDIVVDEALDLVIVTAGPNELMCWTDVDRDAAHDLELVRFYVQDRSLYRDTSETATSTSASTRLVGSWVANGDDPGDELFTYYGMNGALLPVTAGYVKDTTMIREVHINLFVDVIVGDKPEHHVLSSVVQPRNLRLY